MAYVPPSSLSCALNPFKPGLSSSKPNLRNCTVKTLKLSSSSNPSSDESSSSTSQNSLDHVKASFAEAKAYKKLTASNPTPKIVDKLENKNDGSVTDVKFGGKKDIPSGVKLAMEKAKDSLYVHLFLGLDGGERGTFGRRSIEKNVSKKEGPTISSIDFMGLNFSDKKQGRELPAGLVPVSDPFPEGDLPEVEIIVGDASKFKDAAASKPNTAREDDSDLYKPKVSTWGVFPRPVDISKAYGGGRTIQPGHVLETEKDKAAKEKRTRQLIAAYKSQIGLNIDPQLKAECQNDGDSLMDLGKLKEALPFYEKVMDKLPFKEAWKILQTSHGENGESEEVNLGLLRKRLKGKHGEFPWSELHGLAALQWSICQDSLSRSDEARVMYEKLQSHPNVRVSKKARQFVFGFQAMEMMKVRSSSLSSTSMGYQNFFEAFLKNNGNYILKEAEVDESKGALSQALPYIAFLVSPIFIVLFIAVQKGI
ncbi:hypothetical protein RJ640_027486 [Escallonia rubra]|uniref:Uncharacterized protein n=1 Tax=Escallonia rubra TaxID=112253 RepID=A0AA88RL67_9ASTE|nr:hypothetical protein RJ640_027486 [Escallonia rubra]